MTHGQSEKRITGRKHKDCVRMYYQNWLEKEAARLIAYTQRDYRAGLIQGTAAATMAQANLTNAPLSDDLKQQVLANNEYFGRGVNQTSVRSNPEAWVSHQDVNMGSEIGFGRMNNRLAGGHGFQGFAGHSRGGFHNSSARENNRNEGQAGGKMQGMLYRDPLPRKDFTGATPMSAFLYQVPRTGVAAGGSGVGGTYHTPGGTANPMPQNALNTNYNSAGGLKGNSAINRPMSVVNPIENISHYGSGRAYMGSVRPESHERIHNQGGPDVSNNRPKGFSGPPKYHSFDGKGGNTSWSR